MRNLTAEQIILEIHQAFEGNETQEEGLYTFKELKTLLGLSDGALYKRLDILEMDNRLDVATKMVRTRGITRGGTRVWRPVPAYRVLSSRQGDTNSSGV